MEGLALKIYRSFFTTTLCLLAFLLALGLAIPRSVNAGGLILGWAGMQVYLFCFCKTMGRTLDGNTPAGSARPAAWSPAGLPSPASSQARSPAAMDAAYFRFSLLLLVLAVAATRGPTVFGWTAGTILAVFLGWLGFLLYWQYHKAAEKQDWF